MKRYDKYKHSGVEWMGEIPEYWNKKRLKHLTENNDAKRIPLSSDQRGLKQGDIPYYGANGIIDYIDEYIFDGDYVLIGEDGAPFFIPYRDVALKASGKFWVNNHAHILKCKSGFNENIFVHQLNSVDYKQYITGSTRDKLTQENLSGIIIIDIPSEEQTAIAGFLDEKTTQIDKLISNKQKLIELLKEERTAIINQAVTRGVNPNVKLKPSGIDWLGNIPEHWEVKKLKYLSESGLKNGLFKKSYEFGAGTKLINVSDLYVEGDYIDSKNLDRVSCDSAEENNYSVNLGDIFFVRSSLKREGVAKPACIRVVQEPIVFECHLIKISPIMDVVDFNFLNYFLNYSYVREKLISLSITTTMTTISQTSIGNVYVCIPQIDEQTQIVQHIETETKRIDGTISKIEKEIELLQEYRTALISEVVTGKIKVI